MLTLVTGATGLVGNNVVRQLIARGGAVRVLSRGGAQVRPLAGLDVEVVQGDVRDEAAVARAVKGAATVIHCAAHVHLGWSGAAEAEQTNVEGTRRVAAAALAAGARLVHVSSIDAFGTTTKTQPGDENTPADGGVLCPYVVTKRKAEQVVLELVVRGLDARIANPGYMIGPNDWKPSSGRMLLLVAKGRALFAPLGSNQFCDVRDVADGILAAAERGQAGRRYILGGEWLSYFAAWQIMAAATGSLAPKFPIGPAVRFVSGRLGDAWGKLAGREPDINSASTAISGLCRNFKHARATAELGYHCRPLRESAADAWLWFQEHGYA